MNYAEARSRVVDELRKQLIGPVSEKNTLRGINPLDRFPTGVIFPIIRGEEGIDPASVNESDDDYAGDDNETEESEGAKPAAMVRRYTPPSSVGFSFFARGDLLRFQVMYSAARYERVSDRDRVGRFISTEYRRRTIGGESEALTFEARISKSHNRFNDRISDLNKRAGLDVLWRPYLDGWIVTVSLFNQQEWVVEGNQKLLSRQRNEMALYEVKLRCILEEGEIGTYPHVDRSLLTQEEKELELQYKNRHIFAIGHGAAVDWQETNGLVKEIWSEFLPAVEVPQVTADVAGDSFSVLGLAYLAACENETRTWDELEQFVEDYSEWISERKEDVGNFDLDEQMVAKGITQRMDIALSRMRRGVLLLRRDKTAVKAFRLANQAILDQMRQTDLVHGKTREDSDYQWRPFQLAFILTVIESVTNDDDEFRDVVDLIWFPTGGGKTEAYLGLVAFLIVWRRLKYRTSGGGTIVIMRYTLRLLTTQQYLRATRMICALELIRQSDPSLGEEPITVGMWVGAQTSPNSFFKASGYAQLAGDGDVSAQKQLVLDRCPWCNSTFGEHKNYVATKTQFYFRCTNPGCEFDGQQQLPCNVVDEALYDNPPTMLLATIDKFARLAWDERTSVFFGSGPNKPPELIIQDELHLIAGALGSVAGLYEAALDTVLTQRGVRPKYVASTATIRMAGQQVKRLYGRDLAIFPPPGLSCDDSYFARTVDINVRPGRLYVGYLAPMLDRQHCMAPLAAVLHIAPETVFPKGEEDRDDLLEAWWTQVVYHGSLKGVGSSHNSFSIDVKDLVKRLSKEHCDALKGSECNRREIQKIITRSPAQIAQLTSISSAEENARTFSRLELTRNEEDCLDAVLATNMVSVGLDVARLSLMTINGQPLTTAEYIQASSRVGRSEVPGLVVTNYYRDQARSLSHYENFRPYHDSFYRFVEPTSVTPYTYQARTRALHAALVISIRHSCRNLLANNQAGKFNPGEDGVRNVIESLKTRCMQADGGRGQETARHIDRLATQWRSETEACRNGRTRLDYQARDDDRASRRLLFNHDDKIKGLWATLQSMRNVENSGLLKSS